MAPDLPVRHPTDHIRKDLTASVSLFLASLPLCLGIALASGGPSLSGLIAGIIGGLVVGALSDSEVSVSGPAAGLAVIVADAIRSLGSYESFLVALVLAGLIQLVLGFLKAGRLSSFFPNSVVRGMLVGIGIVIILKQIPHALGRDTDFEGDFEFQQLADRENTLTELVRAFADPAPGAVIISVVSLAILLGWSAMTNRGNRFFDWLPAALVVVVAGVGLNQLFRVSMPEWYLGDSSGHMVRIPDLSGASLSSLMNFPDLSALGSGRVYVVALTLALVASLEALLNLEASERLDPLRRVPSSSRELVAQGIGNITSGLVGGLPVTSVVVRTTTNIVSGAQTRLSTLVNGGLLLLSLFFAGSILNHIPLACLAALLIVVGVNLIKPRVLAAIYGEGMSQFIPFLVTVVGIIFTDLLIGIAMGAVVGLLFVLYTNSQASFRVIREGNNVLIKFQRDMYFLSKPQLKEALQSLRPGDSVLVDGRYATFVDSDVYTLLVDFAETAKNQGIKYELRQVTQRKRNEPTYAPI
ncbi:SulP family inorganic anion transporter [Rudanella paleaurantiibacter]|uniref:SulP family inorganic anion transporter n=1 Tax=Rudanella paleaurantiibacter TaxID=2614655 RepID=A0A7J5TWP1_9BACT|nr:SulP family inorganic anion transporter [Rudanella paleaurantiibacter]KAB7729048.1 SulP family inorganic anion transporter [Rudanella paleaurantiibacter]